MIRNKKDKMEKILTKNKKIQKLISSLIITTMLVPTIFLSFTPKQVEAVNPVGVPVNDFTIQAQGWKNIAKEVLRQALMVVAKNLGHADTRMVEKHYGHLAPSFITEAIRAGAPRYGIKADKQVVPLRKSPTDVHAMGDGGRGPHGRAAARGARGGPVGGH